MLYTIQRKTTVSGSLFNQPVAYYFFNNRLRHRHFLVDIAKLSRTPFLQEHLETPYSVFIEHICNYNKMWLFQPFVETLINIETSYEIILFLLFWFCNICCLVWLPLSWRRFLSYINQSIDLYKIPYPNTNLNWKTEKFSEYFSQYKIRKNYFFRRCTDVAATLLHRRRFTDVFKAS